MTEPFRTRVRRDPLVRAIALLGVRWPRVALAVLTGAGALGSAVALAAVSAWLIARASQMPPVLHLSVAAVAVRTFGISRGLLRYLERLVSHDLALRGMAHLRTEVYRRLADGRTAPLVALRRGDLLGTVGADVDAVGDVVVRGLLPAAVAGVVGLGSAVLVGVLLPAAGAWLALCLLLAGIVAPWWAVRAARRTERRARAARTEVDALTLTALEGGAELAVAGQVDPLLDTLARREREVARAVDAGARPAAVAAATGTAAMGLAVLGSLVLGIPATAAGALTPVELAVVVLTPLAAFEGAALLPAAAVQVLRSHHAAARILDLLDAAAEPVRAASVPTAPGATPSGASGTGAQTLRARRLACAWPGSPPVVRGLDLDIAPGRRIALVGPSGAGKTTVLLTLAGLLPPAAGSVTLDGRDVGALTRAEAASGVAMTAEDAHVFDTTVLENLRVARGDVTPDEAAATLDAVGLGPWLARLPEGLDTVLGPDARRLSGGERRRVLVARALLAPAPLLLLDEPTEHLDDVDGAVLRGLLDGSLTPGRGVLVVTHRLAGLERASEVILLDRTGSVRARGTHDELLASPAADAYRAAWQTEVHQETR
ncbi:thiol reductant ABC exporter subunit CydC [Cellulomonas sp. APG4]|uniref:thiol reductant ABC exporter subunit CydC n=1 Tax=Cellulomonas sp. APG4 TaxID=1538656 RepID=UPI00137A5543|nr:thiol reductant ABC exporter subunit CydC [Cellulomonas sp. APG4]NCT90578.1 thiol reductant ABC exporter subunit CydC [Cellulomonas sp. APG4]